MQAKINELIEAQSYLIDQIEDKQDHLEEIQEAFKEKAQKLYELEAEFELEKGRGQCYKLQMEEIGHTLSKERRERENKLKDKRFFWYEEMLIKEREVETAKRALTMTWKRLQQAEETIHTFMENPTVDPTTLAGKDAKIERLEAEVKELRDVNKIVNKVVKTQLQELQKENDDIKLQLEVLRKQMEKQPTLPATFVDNQRLLPGQLPQHLLTLHHLHGKNIKNNVTVLQGTH